MKKIRSITATAALTLFIALCGPALAIEAGDVRFDDRIVIGGAELVANGAGVRSKFIFDVYAMALYLPAKAGSLDAALANKGSRRIAIQLLRDVSASDFLDGLRKGMQANLGEAELAALKGPIQQFAENIGGIGEVKKNTVVGIDFLPGTGTRVLVGGKAQGKDIAGEAFYDALLKIWLGNKPVQNDLKAKLLGK